MDEIDGADVYLIEVILPLGAIMTYSIDATSHFVIRAHTLFSIGDFHVDTERNYSNYRETNWILYPRSMTYVGRHGVAAITVLALRLNVEFDDDTFVVPASIDEE